MLSSAIDGVFDRRVDRDDVAQSALLEAGDDRAAPRDDREASAEPLDEMRGLGDDAQGLVVEPVSVAQVEDEEEAVAGSEREEQIAQRAGDPGIEPATETITTSSKSSVVSRRPIDSS